MKSNSARKAHGKRFIVYCGVMDALKRIKLTRGISFWTSSAFSIGI